MMNLSSLVSHLKLIHKQWISVPLNSRKWLSALVNKDALVAGAVEKTLPEVALAVDAASESLKAGV